MVVWFRKREIARLGGRMRPLAPIQKARLGTHLCDPLCQCHSLGRIHNVGICTNLDNFMTGYLFRIVAPLPPIPAITHISPEQHISAAQPAPSVHSQRRLQGPIALNRPPVRLLTTRRSSSRCLHHHWSIPARRPA
jgi:hypothetical protein